MDGRTVPPPSSTGALSPRTAPIPLPCTSARDWREPPWSGQVSPGAPSPSSKGPGVGQQRAGVRCRERRQAPPVPGASRHTLSCSGQTLPGGSRRPGLQTPCPWEVPLCEGRTWASRILTMIGDSAGSPRRSWRKTHYHWVYRWDPNTESRRELRASRVQRPPCLPQCPSSLCGTRGLTQPHPMSSTMASRASTFQAPPWVQAPGQVGMTAH